ncbi:MAG: 4Fe-4S cluster-binding domain-containing protein [Leptonema sp. (in: Bacteria)]|nr:4Fe-4S cluster-binding domain-containing protein [Leptonema sp. (in: bacteria)]
MVDSLRLTEMFLSLQGEGEHTGLICYFIRTSGCDLRCRWCDTSYSWTGGKKYSIDSIIESIPSKVPLIQITGGEPLLQKEGVIQLIERLPNHKILLETAGHQSLEGLPKQTHIVMDIKLAGSNEQNHPFENNFQYIKPSDEIKFVIADRADYDSAKKWIHNYSLDQLCKILVSPVFGELAPVDLAKWVIQDRLPVRLQLQQHKFIWNPDQRGV